MFIHNTEVGLDSYKQEIKKYSQEEKKMRENSCFWTRGHAEAFMCGTHGLGFTVDGQ